MKKRLTMTRTEFNDAIKCTQKALRRFLLALCCGDGALADDLAQETYIKAYLASEGFRNDASFSTWLHRIAINTFVSYRRTHRQSEDIEKAQSIHDSHAADSAFEYQPLYNALARLTVNERTATTLYYLEGYDIKEIAKMADTSVDSVKQRLLRARKHLRIYLNNTKL